MLSKGAIFYITNQDKYVKYASVSAASAKEHMPDVDRYLFVPNYFQPNQMTHFTDVFTLPDMKRSDKWFFDQIRYTVHVLEHLYTGYETAIYMDVDTFFLSPVYDLFELVRIHFDYCGTHAPARFTAPTLEDIPLSFPEFNIGVNPMNIANCIGMWKRVVAQLDENEQSYDNNDQMVLRDTLWLLLGYDDTFDDFRIHFLPPEYNFRFAFPQFACREVKILHGGTDDNNLKAFYEEIGRRVNARQGMRVWQNQNLV